MPRKPLSTDFLRPEKSITLVDSKIALHRDLNKTLEEAGIMVANVSRDFRDFYVNCFTRTVDTGFLHVGTVVQQMPDAWLAAFYHWAGVRLGEFLGAIALQGDGPREGEVSALLTNGKLNGCILLEYPQYSATARWHDPKRPYEEQTAQYPRLGWSLHVVETASRRWCPQGGRIIYFDRH